MRSFPLGLRWANMGEDYLLYGNVVMMRTLVSMLVRRAGRL